VKAVIFGFILMSYACVAVHAEGDSTAFSISDYKPQFFRDLEWTVDGNLGLSGTYYDSETNAAAQNSNTYFYLRDDEKDQTLAGIMTSSGFDYRRETLRSVLSLSATADFTFDYQRRENSEFVGGLEPFVSPPYDSERVNSTRVRRDWRAGITSDLILDKYILKDGFARLTVYGFYSYHEIPKEDWDESRLQFTDLSDREVTALYISSQYASGDERIASVSATVGAGWGRVWEGEYASTAMYIVEELRSSGALQRDPGREEMLELTGLIHEWRQSHVVDSRIRRLDALNSLLSYLHEIGAIGEPAPSWVYIIQDVWDYFPRYRRRFGSSVAVGIGGDYTYDSEHGNSSSRNFNIVSTVYDASPGIVEADTTVADRHRYHFDRVEHTRAYLYAKADWYRPLQRKWQLDLAGRARLVLHNRADGDFLQYYSCGARSEGTYVHEDDSDSWLIDLSASTTYIHDSRSRLIAGADFLYRGYKRDSTRYTAYYQFLHRKSVNWHYAVLSVTAEYRISIPTTLQAQARYVFDRSQTHATVHNRAFNIGIGLTHYIY